MIYFMYKPIANNDDETIYELMRLYKKYYQVIGFVVLLGGMILLPFIPNIISGNIPLGINLYILYLMNLGETVLSYWLLAYKNGVLNAYHRVDIINKVTIVTDRKL